MLWSFALWIPTYCVQIMLYNQPFVILSVSLKFSFFYHTKSHAFMNITTSFSSSIGYIA